MGSAAASATQGGSDVDMEVPGIPFRGETACRAMMPAAQRSGKKNEVRSLLGTAIILAYNPAVLATVPRLHHDSAHTRWFRVLPTAVAVGLSSPRKRRGFGKTARRRRR